MSIISAPKTHFKARGLGDGGAKQAYPDGPFRFLVPDEFASFQTEFEGYQPVEFVHSRVTNSNASKADPSTIATLKFNCIDGVLDRTSFHGTYTIGADGRPLNPVGRTGMTNRGRLRRWGPNHCADPIVTRFHNGKLQFVAINRKDGGGWAFPGGNIEPGDTVQETLKKEFGEEALNSLQMSPEALAQTEKQLDELFAHGVEIFRGYVDDPRNTDNAWMETAAVNIHLSDDLAATLNLCAGDDAGDVAWMDVSADTKLYASHRDLLAAAAARHGVTL